MSGNLSFDTPWVLLGFTLFIPLILYDYLSIQKKAIYKKLPKNLRTKLSASLLFFRLFLCCGIIALAGPRWGIGQAAGEYRRMVDAVIALDVSRSMEVVDIQGANGNISRLEHGLSIVRESVAAMPGTRFGIAVSRNRGIVTIPLTWDNGAIFAFLDAIHGRARDTNITGRGTNLESLVDAAAGAFQSSYPSARVILLVSDGEALTGTLKSALGRCNQNGISIVSIAMGSDIGSYLPSGEITTNILGNLSEGEVPSILAHGSVTFGEGVGGEEKILSRRDPGVMRMAAGQTGGIYIDGNRGDASRALTAYLRSLAPESEIRSGKKELKARWLIFVILAIIAFGASNFSLLRLKREK